ncbi:MAG: GGDEF domain-containing protein [Lachnospiraceae bacterium]|nr:GGDEF domain-containing protein [Lachnospiraceae bacterium]
MRLRISTKKRIIAFFCMFLLIFSCASPVLAVEKSGSEVKTVKVGYYENASFQEGASKKSMKRGYAYEYLQKIASLTGWKYEYVYGDWADLYQKFLDGKIDLLAGLAHTDDRVDKMLYPDLPMGKESYFMYSRIGDNTVTTNIETLSGKKIGAMKGAMLTTLSDWLLEKNINATVVGYEDAFERDKALESGEVDCAIGESVMVQSSETIQPLLKVKDIDMYLCVTNDRKDLLADLNKAQSQIELEDPYFTVVLTQKYFTTSGAIRTVTAREREYLKKHPVIKIGFYEDYLPFCGTKNGKIVGLISDIFPKILKNLGINDEVKVKYVPYKNGQKIVEDLQDGDLDIIFPATDNIYYLEQMNLFQSRSVIQTGMDLVFKGKFTKDTKKRIAVNRNNIAQLNYVRLNFPDSEIAFFNSIEECINAVATDNATATVVNSYRTSGYIRDTKFEDLSTMTLPDGTDRCFAVNQNNTVLLSIINRGLGTLTDDYALNSVYKYSGRYVDYTLFDFMKTHFIQTVAIILSLFATLIFFSVIIYNKTRNQKIFDRMAHMDSMTGLLNRRSYEECFNELKKHGMPNDFCYVSLDMNGLKNVNDTLGHDAGDEMIIGVADCLKSAFQFYGDVYRTGGDEFIAIIEASSKEVSDIKVVLDEKLSSWEGHLVKNISLAVGFVEKREFPEYTIVEISKIADRRMYDKKSEYYANLKNVKR